MRIVHTDTDDLGNPLRGGQPVRTFEINSRLSPRHDITVFTATYPGCVRRETKAGVTYRRVGTGTERLGLSYHLSFLASLPVAIRNTPHDLVVEEFTPPVGFCLSPWWSGKPVVSIVQWFFFGDWERKYHLPFSRIMKALPKVSRYRNFIVQTDRMGNYFRELIPQASIWKIPCGIGDAAFSNTPNDGDYALFLGRLDIHHKGLDLLLDAWTKLRESGLRIPLKIVGAGQGEAWLRERIEAAGLQEFVELPGRLENGDKLEMLRGCRFLVMPSRQETFGITALEAMAAARPVIAFDIDHLNELVCGEAGILVRSGDVEALSREVAALWQDRDRAAHLGARAYQHARRFRWDEIAGLQEQVYSDVVNRQRRHS